MRTVPIMKYDLKRVEPELTETLFSQIIVKCADWVYNSIVDRLSEGSSWTSWRNRHGLGLAVLVSKFMYLGGSVLVMMMTTLMFQVGKWDCLLVYQLISLLFISEHVLFFFLIICNGPILRIC